MFFFNLMNFSFCISFWPFTGNPLVVNNITFICEFYEHFTLKALLNCPFLDRGKQMLAGIPRSCSSKYFDFRKNIIGIILLTLEVIPAYFNIEKVQSYVSEESLTPGVHLRVIHRSCFPEYLWTAMLNPFNTSEFLSWFILEFFSKFTRMWLNPGLIIFFTAGQIVR